MKKYPFSARKHAHDIDFRRDRCFNEICKLEIACKDTRKHRILLEQLDTLRNMLVGDIGVVWLTGEQYALAQDCVRWAVENRR